MISTSERCCTFWVARRVCLSSSAISFYQSGLFFGHNDFSTGSGQMAFPVPICHRCSHGLAAWTNTAPRERGSQHMRGGWYLGPRRCHIGPCGRGLPRPTQKRAGKIQSCRQSSGEEGSCAKATTGCSDWHCARYEQLGPTKGELQ